MDDSAKEMYASEIDAGPTPVQIIEACIVGAHEIWEGRIHVEVDDGRPVVAFYASSEATGEVLMEAYSLAIAQVDDHFRLITGEIVDNTGMGGVCGWSMHTSAINALNAAPASVVSGEDARQLFQDSQGDYVNFSKDG
jgi:hypothetical protein